MDSGPHSAQSSSDSRFVLWCGLGQLSCRPYDPPSFLAISMSVLKTLFKDVKLSRESLYGEQLLRAWGTVFVR